MTTFQILVLLGLLVGLPTALYGLHRLALWLEARGHLYYLHKQPGSSPASSFVALQQFVEPQSKHVHHVHEQKRHHSEDEGAGGQAPGAG